MHTPYIEAFPSRAISSTNPLYNNPLTLPILQFDFRCCCYSGGAFHGPPNCTSLSQTPPDLACNRRQPPRSPFFQSPPLRNFWPPIIRSPLAPTPTLRTLFEFLIVVLMGTRSCRCCLETEIWRAIETSAAVLRRASCSSSELSSSS
jgi:hypothetical protein